MTIFVDASALVAMLRLESEFKALGDELDRYDLRLTSPIACWETVAALCRSYDYEPAIARAELDAFLTGRAIKVVSISAPEAAVALDAYAKFGKRRHPAGLNMGDCFAYACTKANEARLLYKGNDFAQTDLA